METFVAAITVMMSLSVATFQVIRNVKYRELAERKHRLMPVLLYLNSVLFMCDLLNGGPALGMRFTVDVMMAMIPLSVISSTLWSVSRYMKVVYVFLSAMALMSMYHVLCLMGLSSLPSQNLWKWIAIALTLLYVFFFLCGIWYRVREVRAVIQAATVWAGVSLAVETVYMVIVLSELILLMSFAGGTALMQCSFVILLCGAMTSYGLRVVGDSLFVLMKRHERRIVESMKITPAEVSGIGPDDIYRDIYERVLEYFDKEKPFLDGNLTINDIVSVVYTNKLYISRAISQHTGRNFCQFVNYHRVMYSVDCFRKNPDLKVTELWSMCGFNTIVSYNMAFKLFMGENPGDWCRKEKIRIFRRPTK
jgi:AraC-like DNA-binding protein